MPLDFAQARPLLQECKLKALFVEHLGWEPCRQQMKITLGGTHFNLAGIAEKKGMVVWQCETDNGRLPDHATRLKLDREVSQTNFEHVLVFVTADRARQLWMWVRREPGRPLRALAHEYLCGQPGDSLLQKLERLFVSLEDEEAGLSVAEIAARARAAFNVERVVRRFYNDFNTQRKAFLAFVKGITEQGDHEWYASVMLNRLMFIYFIQRKGFLDGDPDYLRNRLRKMQGEHGKDKFYSFYRYFLLRLFHDGLGAKQRSKELEKLIGQVPYLNGGIFDQHELERPERYGKTIQIPDEAFQRIFDFFDQWNWHLDDRPVCADNEINPDVLGYIYEKYINQKQMGAYYTKEDITEYISKNTILPFLFDAARAKCKVAFENPNGPTLWDLLRNDPDRYIYPALRHGVDLPLPEEIERGVNPPTLHQPVNDGPVLTLELRKGWNKTAPADYALPSETWREVVARRQRCEEIRRKLAAGEMRDINELITLNLDIRQFAQDVIAGCEGPELLRAFWIAIAGRLPEKSNEKPSPGISILDPTCGSGAFLFAALNILEPLYEACLDRMEAFLQDETAKTEPAKVKRTPHGLPLLPNGRLKDFSDILDHVAGHPSKHYFVYKGIILNNLYGVDIMEEAVEICKLRLFLKLAAQVSPDTTKPNHGVEPLPDIDFNIRAGNTLIGFTSIDEIKRVLGGDLEKMLELPAIEEKAAEAERQFRLFREMQSQRGMDAADFASAKRTLRERLKALEEELNRYLTADYGVKPGKKADFEKWIKTHQPFHWLIDFYGILKERGGFDVIIGNPPYVSAAKVRKQYQVKQLVETQRCTDIYAWVLERSLSLVAMHGRCGMIVPLSLGFSADFDSCRRMLLDGYSDNWFSSFGRIPSALFSFDVRVRNTIHLGLKSSRPPQACTTRLHRWFEVARPVLLQALEYAPFTPHLWEYRIPKLNNARLAGAFERLLSNKRTLASAISPHRTKHVLHFKKTAYNWLNFCRVLPPCYEGERLVEHTQFGTLYFPDTSAADMTMLLANGKLMLTYWFLVGDDFHVASWNFLTFPVAGSIPDSHFKVRLPTLASQLDVAMESAVQFKLNAGRRVGNYNLAKCRDLTDQTDLIFAEAFGLTEVWEDIELYYAQTVKTDFSDDDQDE